MRHKAVNMAAVKQPIIIRYETDAMHCIRQRLNVCGHTDEDIDILKVCLIDLERMGLHLVGELH